MIDSVCKHINSSILRLSSMRQKLDTMYSCSIELLFCQKSMTEMLVGNRARINLQSWHIVFLSGQESRAFAISHELRLHSKLVSLIVLSHEACMLSCCKRNSHDSETLHASFLDYTIPQPLSLLKGLLGSQSCFLGRALGMLWLHFHCCRS